MQSEVLEEYQSCLTSINSFIEDEVISSIGEFEQSRRIPKKLLLSMAKEGFFTFHGSLGSGDKPTSYVQHGLLCRALGRVSCSILSIVTVNFMVAKALNKWGSDIQRDRWLSRIISGQCIAAFAITEPLVGSDAENPTTYAADMGNYWEISGKKKWISCGQVADLFLISAQVDKKTTCFLVERQHPGIIVNPLDNVDGFRAAMLAEIEFDKVRIPKDCIIGAAGTGFSIVLNYALNFGRLSIAWGALGLADTCLNKAFEYAEQRIQFKKPLIEQPLIQQKLTRAICNIRATELACLYGSQMLDRNHASAPLEINVAKYLAAKTALDTAKDSMHIHGAAGLTDADLQRCRRDADVISLIEGSNEIQEMLVPQIYRLLYV